MGCRSTDQALVLPTAGRGEFTDAAAFRDERHGHQDEPSFPNVTHGRHDFSGGAERRAAVSHSTSALLDED
jgi:hypothetical protein